MSGYIDNDPIEVEPLLSFGGYGFHPFDIVAWLTVFALGFSAGMMWRVRYPYWESAKAGDTIVMTPDCELQMRAQER